MLVPKIRKLNTNNKSAIIKGSMDLIAGLIEAMKEFLVLKFLKLQELWVGVFLFLML